MYYTLTLILSILILFIQYQRNRLLTSATFWVGFYICFFLISPVLLQTRDLLAEQYAWWGLFSYFLGFVYISLIYKPHPSSCEHYKPLHFKRSFLDILVIVSIISLLGYIGAEGIHNVLNGELTSRIIMQEQGGILRNLYFFSLILLGYTLVFYYVMQNARFTLRQYIYLFLFVIQVMLFSFTRAPLFLCVGMLVIYKMRNFSRSVQLQCMLVTVLVSIILMSMLMWIRVFGLTEGLLHFSWSRLLNEAANNLDFAIGYQAFVDLVNSPRRISWLVYFKPLFAFIPRSVWLEKPLRGSMAILWQLNPMLAAKGYSTGFTNLGVPLAVFGKIGIFIAPFIWGIITNFFDTWYMLKKRIHKDNDFYTMLYIYFAVVFTLQTFREGSDVAIFNGVFVFLELLLIASWKISFKFKRY